MAGPPWLGTNGEEIRIEVAAGGVVGTTQGINTDPHAMLITEVDKEMGEDTERRRESAAARTEWLDERFVMIQTLLRSFA